MTADSPTRPRPALVGVTILSSQPSELASFYARVLGTPLDGGPDRAVGKSAPVSVPHRIGDAAQDFGAVPADPRDHAVRKVDGEWPRLQTIRDRASRCGPV